MAAMQQQLRRHAFSNTSEVAKEAAELRMACGGTAQPRLTVGFDGACPLCRRGVDLHRTMSGGETIESVDIAGRTDEQFAPGLTRDGATGRLHAHLPDGRLV
jgi:predicted DCC family thiol-disulfide oxidoreductase YuxK